MHEYIHSQRLGRSIFSYFLPTDWRISTAAGFWVIDCHNADWPGFKLKDHAVILTIPIPWFRDGHQSFSYEIVHAFSIWVPQQQVGVPVSSHFWLVLAKYPQLGHRSFNIRIPCFFTSFGVIFEWGYLPSSSAISCNLTDNVSLAVDAVIFPVSPNEVAVERNLPRWPSSHPTAAWTSSWTKISSTFKLPLIVGLMKISVYPSSEHIGGQHSPTMGFFFARPDRLGHPQVTRTLSGIKAGQEAFLKSSFSRTIAALSQSSRVHQSTRLMNQR